MNGEVVVLQPRLPEAAEPLLDRSGHRHNAVECALGELQSGGSATVEIVLLPTVPGTSTNRALGGGKHSPENLDEATITVKPAAG